MAGTRASPVIGSADRASRERSLGFPRNPNKGAREGRPTLPSSTLPLSVGASLSHTAVSHIRAPFNLHPLDFNDDILWRMEAVNIRHVNSRCPLARPPGGAVVQLQRLSTLCSGGQTSQAPACGATLARGPALQSGSEGAPPITARLSERNLIHD
ncbi:hypothetical protein AAFF_G00203560 [Aldrovandia affinis]|uniref:Uncharacterized protein n=1 Tax=Aldrovandia affinis TaxID=143900 RepID=A0AAD7SX59_9TELE|nr:hypothetical protein AAFF_G00203560 [Aldrovandia affinis]